MVWAIDGAYHVYIPMFLDQMANVGTKMFEYVCFVRYIGVNLNVYMPNVGHFWALFS